MTLEKIKNLNNKKLKYFLIEQIYLHKNKLLLKTAKTYLNLYEAIELNKLAKK